MELMENVFCINFSTILWKTYISLELMIWESFKSQGFFLYWYYKCFEYVFLIRSSSILIIIFHEKTWRKARFLKIKHCTQEHNRWVRMSQEEEGLSWFLLKKGSGTMKVNNNNMSKIKCSFWL